MKAPLTLFLSCLMVATATADSLKGSRPNIIFVMTDDQGSNLSYMGHPIVETPHIDAFAAKSLYFSEYHVSPSCAPTRAALLSGRHEFRNGVTHTIYERELMALSTTTFPQLLQDAGYETGIFGKWHLGDIEEYLPGNRGFSEVLIHGAGGIGQKYPGSCADFVPNREKEGRYFDNVLLHNDTVVQTEGYCTDVFFHGALAWIKEQHEAKQPYFAYISTNTPHSPLIAPDESLQRIVDRHPHLKVKGVGRFGMIENIDDNFGMMMQKLEAWGALDNTLIIFTTDNGAPHKPGSDAFNAGYRTGKGTVNEGGVHVPAFWYWKDTLAEGQEVDALTAHIDLYQTFCDLAGVTIPNDIQELDGRSLLPILEDPQAEWDDRMLFATRGRWDAGEAPNKESGWSVRTDRWRLVGEELYDISKDPFESKDVATQYPEVVSRLSQAYDQWWIDTLPLMVNEDREWNQKAPLETLYNKQKAERGIPEWMPAEI